MARRRRGARFWRTAVSTLAPQRRRIACRDGVVVAAAGGRRLSAARRPTAQQVGPETGAPAGRSAENGCPRLRRSEFRRERCIPGAARSSQQTRGAAETVAGGCRSRRCHGAREVATDRAGARGAHRRRSGGEGAVRVDRGVAARARDRATAGRGPQRARDVLRETASLLGTALIELHPLVCLPYTLPNPPVTCPTSVQHPTRGPRRPARPAHRSPQGTARIRQRPAAAIR